MSFEIGSPVIYSNKNCIVSKGPYTARFLNSADYDLISHGMGHLAGSYGTAYDLFDVDSGITHRKVSLNHVKRIEE
mgnify:CR=1 FL=1